MQNPGSEERDMVSARPRMTAALMERTGLDERILTTLVHRFYARVRADTVLGPIFEDRISDWAPHLHRMVTFWSSVALMTGRYHGAPVPAHVELPIEWEHFERWLALFRKTAHETCPAEGAAHVIACAERIARSLHMAVESAGPRIVPSLQQSEETDMNAPQNLAELTRFIEEHYHAQHRTQLPALVKLAEKIETVHFGDEQVPEGLSDLLNRMIGELEVHMKKEELILFPAIRRASAGLDAPVAAIRNDHDDHASDIARIRRLTNSLTPPDGACPSWTRLYAELGAFIDELEAHIRLENDVLFPQVETRSGRNV